MRSLLAYAAILAAAGSALAAPVGLDADIIPNKFIVQLRPGISAASIAAHHNLVRDLHSRSVSRRDGALATLSGLTKSFTAGDFSAYAGEFDASLVSEIAALPEVLLVEPDRYIYPAALVTQTDVEWHLGSISHRAENSTEYIYDESAGEGTFAYVVDSGIRLSHEEFEGRASLGYNAVAGAEDGDQIGHGTHVAGIVAGKLYGVAKKATVIDIKVFGNANGALSEIVDGITWAVDDIVSKNRQSTSVINMSLGGPAISEALDNAVINIYNMGILPVCAAGNGNANASTWSPAHVAECVTVGNVEPSLRRQHFDDSSFGSNYGPAVDIFAPGTDIVAAAHTSDTDTIATTGTSDAAPVVAGLALYLQALEGLSTPDEVRSRMFDLSTKDVVTEPEGSQNRLAYNGNA